MNYRLFKQLLTTLLSSLVLTFQSFAMSNGKLSEVQPSATELAGAYRIVVYGAPYEKGVDFSHVEAAQGVLVVTKLPFSQKQLPPEPKPAFAFYHYHLLGIDSSEYNVCLWLRPKYMDDDITKDVSFIVTSYQVKSGNFVIPINRSPDSGIDIQDIKQSDTGFTAVAWSYLAGPKPVSWQQSIIATRDNNISLRECLNDGVHVATVMDKYNIELVQMRESLDNWFFSKKKPNK
jgi:hypothetical protein